jgi:hypothetical protein
VPVANVGSLTELFRDKYDDQRGSRKRKTSIRRYRKDPGTSPTEASEIKISYEGRAMSNIRSFKAISTLLLGMALSLTVGTAMAADVNMWDGNWHYDFALYGWFPGIKGTFNVDLPPGVIIPPPGLNISHSANVNANDYLSALQFAAMLAGEARRGNVAILGDLIYVDASSLKSKIRHVSGPEGDVTLPVNADANFGLRTTIFTVAGSYTIDRTRLGNFDLLAGARIADLKTSLDWNFSGPDGILSQSGGTSHTENLYDGIVGARGAVALSSDGKWYLPYYADIGGGNNSNWTWQAYAGVGYRFDWGSVLVAFRNLSYNEGGGKKIENLSLTGPLIAVDWRW